MDQLPFLMYSFSNPTYYENIDLYDPSNEYLTEVESILPDDWKVKKNGFWTRCSPSEWSYIKHGWKIHVSSVPANAVETVKIVASVLVNADIAFKFCSDPKMLKMSLSKSWSRFQAGKFVAIYPKSLEEFKYIIDVLHSKTAHLTGPHVLTDRAYRDSRVIFYRYGAHLGEFRVDPYGYNLPGFVLDDGSWYEDIRGPSFRLPPGYSDPFHEVSGKDKTPKGPILLNDRYIVEGVIKFSATGGIYFGVDKLSGREIIVREVRGTLGHLESEMPDDPTYILKREARILQRLSPTGLVPEFIDLFKEWNNWFLVEERLEALSLWGHSMDFYFSEEYQTSSFGLEKILSTIEAIANGLKVIHGHGVVLHDLTRNNVMFTKQGNVKFIDFEFAFEINGNGRWVNGWTPGYASDEQVALQRPVPEDDHYALGALILDMLTFSATGLDLGRAAILDKLKQVLLDLSLPEQLYELVTGLTEKNVSQRWNIERVLACLGEMQVASPNVMMFTAKEDLLKIEPPTLQLIDSLKETESGLVQFLTSSSDLTRKDRLWPSSPELFVTNPVSIQYGATGVAWFLQRSNGYVDPNILDWIEKRAHLSLCPPGLYAGLGGVALLLLTAGRTDSAQATMERIANDEHIFTFPSLYFGCAGWGLTNLHFWQQTGEPRYLEAARQVGNRLLRDASESEKGLHWTSGGKIYLGLGDGQSGIALFLTYLGAACNDQRFIKAAAMALEFDISHSVHIAGRICWKNRTDAKEHDPNFPHTRFGSAGVGTACIRYFALTGDIRFKEVALDCAHSVRSRVTNKIWQDSGNAGYGEFLLDMEYFLGDERFGSIAYYQAEGLLPYALKFPNGIAFAGTDHYRVCCEFSTGGAGIGIFINRLLHKKPRFLMLDDLIR